MPLRAAGIGWVSSAVATLALVLPDFGLSASIPPHPVSDKPAGQLCSSILLSSVQLAPGLCMFSLTMQILSLRF